MSRKKYSKILRNKFEINKKLYEKIIITITFKYLLNFKKSF